MARLRIPIGVGNAVEVLGILLAFYLLLTAARAPSTLLRFLLYAISMGCLEFFPHGLAHYLTGRLVGVRFKYYFLAKSSATKLKLPLLSELANQFPVLALKIEPESLRSASGGKRAMMFASGAAASMILPFIAPVASIGRVPALISGILFFVAVANVGFDLYYSPKAGDLSRIHHTQWTWKSTPA
jgi:hypothetical protein